MICGVFFMQKEISQIVHLLLLLLLLPVEETKLKNHSTINHDIAHVGSWNWWLVHRHKSLSLTPLLLVILMIISLVLYIIMLE